MMRKEKHKALFLDRDGVINKKPTEGDYIKSWDEFKFLPGVKEAIKKLNEHGFLVIIVSNQRGISKGVLTEDTLQEIHRRMEEELKKEDALINGIYYCPHDIEEHCECRKPKPGLLLKAAREHNIELNKSWMIGDSLLDIEAGERAGSKTILIGDYSKDSSQEIKPNLTAKNLLEAVNKILNIKNSSKHS